MKFDKFRCSWNLQNECFVYTKYLFSRKCSFDATDQNGSQNASEMLSKSVQNQLKHTFKNLSKIRFTSGSILDGFCLQNQGLKQSNILQKSVLEASCSQDGARGASRTVREPFRALLETTCKHFERFF